MGASQSLKTQTQFGLDALQIQQEVKLDFSDVLILPQKSAIKSRALVSLERTFQFPSLSKSWTVVPIMVANMDTTGTFEMAAAMAKYKCLTAIHKYYTTEQWIAFSKEHPEALPYTIISAGALLKDFETASSVLSAIPQIQAICLDVANGYSEILTETLIKYRKTFPQHIIIAGNVVTPGMTTDLILNGANIIKIGIGPGSVCTTRT
jgi:GMP reductase